MAGLKTTVPMVLAAALCVAVPANADCAKFEALVASADAGRGFEDVVPFRGFLDLRDNEVSAAHHYPGFDQCKVVDSRWSGHRQHYGEPQYICTLDPKPDAAGKLTFERAIEQTQAMSALMQEVIACVQADPRFKIDNQGMSRMSFLMKPELTNMRGMYDNPRVAVEAVNLSSRLSVEPSPKDPMGLVQAQQLQFTISGIVQDFRDGPKPRAE